MISAVCLRTSKGKIKRVFTVKNIKLEDCIRHAKNLGFKHIHANEMERFIDNDRELLVLQGLTKYSFKRLHLLYRIACMRTWVR